MKLKKKDLKYYKDQLAKKRLVRQRIVNMIGDVSSWQPPSPEHDEFKTFMTSQLMATLDHDGDLSYYLRSIGETTAKDPAEYYPEAVQRCQTSIAHTKESMTESEERHDGRSKWITDLFDSLTPYDNGAITLKLLAQKV